jgi:hypothetical protein
MKKFMNFLSRVKQVLFLTSLVIVILAVTTFDYVSDIRSQRSQRRLDLKPKYPPVKKSRKRVRAVKKDL